MSTIYNNLKLITKSKKTWLSIVLSKVIFLFLVTFVDIFSSLKSYNIFLKGMPKTKANETSGCIELERIKGFYQFKRLAFTTQKLYLDLLNKYFIWLKLNKKKIP